MTSVELSGKLDLLNRRLAIARKGQRWDDVAAMQAERQALVEELDVALQAESVQQQ